MCAYIVRIFKIYVCIMLFNSVISNIGSECYTLLIFVYFLLKITVDFCLLSFENLIFLKHPSYKILCYKFSISLNLVNLLKLVLRGQFTSRTFAYYSYWYSTYCI